MKKLRYAPLACVLTLAATACVDDDAALLASMTPAVDVEPQDTPDTEVTDTPEPKVLSTLDTEVTDTPDPEDLDDSGSSPELTWRACGQVDNRNLECAEVEVPGDYDQPEGETLFVSVRRILANPLEPYHGALLFNPGGPGSEGLDLALNFVESRISNAIAPGYDLIGFDPVFRLPAPLAR